MKIKIKSREEIEKTLEEGIAFFRETHVGQYKGSDFTMRKEMLEFCGMESEAKRVLDGRALAFDWYWHPDWYEVMEPDFTEEDLMNIELMDEMLEYFSEGVS